MSFHILLLFLQLYFTSGSIISLECMDKFEEFHKCRKRVDEEFRAWKPEDDKGQVDVYERFVCRLFTKYTDCTDHILGCLRYDEPAILKDNDVARFNMSKDHYRAPNWSSEKCPVTRDYERRRHQGYSGYSRECNEAIRELRLCRGRATQKFYEDYFEDYDTDDDERYPDMETQENDRKKVTCTYHTSVLSSCTSAVPTTCFSKASRMKMKFAIFIDKASINRMFRSGVDECLSVKEVFEAWEDSKKENVNAGVEVFTTTNDGLEKRDMILASKIKTIAKDDLENMPAILEATKDELIFELKKKALAVNSKAIADLKLEVHSVFEGIFNVILYGTLP